MSPLLSPWSVSPVSFQVYFLHEPASSEPRSTLLLDSCHYQRTMAPNATDMDVCENLNGYRSRPWMGAPTLAVRVEHARRPATCHRASLSRSIQHPWYDSDNGPPGVISLPPNPQSSALKYRFVLLLTLSAFRSGGIMV